MSCFIKMQFVDFGFVDAFGVPVALCSCVMVMEGVPSDGDDV